MVETIAVTKKHILVPNYRGRLTEGITYEPRNNSVLWVDIIVAEIHRFYLDTEVHEMLSLPGAGESIGAIARTNDVNKVLACTKSGVSVADFGSKQFTPLVKYELSESQLKRLRSNDGIVDPWGDLLIGLMNDFDVCAESGPQPEGLLLKIRASDLSTETIFEKTIISNGLGFTHDRKRFLWTDSLTFNIWEFDVVDGKFVNKRSLVNTKDVFPEYESPEPDGMCLTTDGELYTAVFGTATVAHFNENGKLVTTFKVPAEKVTCCTIGGPDNDQLFITTGHEKLTDPNHSIKLNEGGDLGGYIYRIQLAKPVSIETKHVWGGKV